MKMKNLSLALSEDSYQADNMFADLDKLKRSIERMYFLFKEDSGFIESNSCNGFMYHKVSVYDTFLFKED